MCPPPSPQEEKNSALALRAPGVVLWLVRGRVSELHDAVHVHLLHDDGSDGVFLFLAVLLAASCGSAECFGAAYALAGVFDGSPYFAL